MPSPHTVTGSQQCHQETPMAVPQDGLAFSTFVVGSLPRPRWVRDLIEDRKAGRISAKDADELLDDAVPLAIRLQERAGLDYVSDGEWAARELRQGLRRRCQRLQGGPIRRRELSVL